MTNDRDYERGIRELRRQFDDGVDARAVDDVHRRLRVALAEKRASRTPLLVGLGFAGVAAVVLAVVWMRPGQVAHVAPPVETVALVGWDVANAVGTTEVVAAGSRLSVSKGGQLNLAVGTTARIAAMGPAELSVDVHGRVTVTDGVAVVSVAKQSPGHQFAMSAGDATIIVHGTAFVIDAQASVLHGVSVSEGRVEVREASGKSVFLTPGELWGVAPPIIAMDPFTAPAWRAAAGERITVAPAALEEEPAPVRRPDDKPRPALRVDSFALAETAVRRGQCAAAAGHVARFVESAKDDNDAARALMLEADCWMHGKERARALPALDRVANDFPKSTRASSALFEASKLRSDLRMTKDASTGFATYLARYPSGPLAESASFRHCELLGELGTANSACLETHLEQFASGRRVGDALLMLGSSACEHDKWADAERAYWRYIETIPASRDDVHNLRLLLGCLERGHVGSYAKAQSTFTSRHPVAGD